MNFQILLDFIRDLKSGSHFLSLFLRQWKRFKNDEKLFLLNPKGSFRSQDV